MLAVGEGDMSELELFEQVETRIRADERAKAQHDLWDRILPNGSFCWIHKSCHRDLDCPRCCPDLSALAAEHRKAERAAVVKEIAAWLERCPWGSRTRLVVTFLAAFGAPATTKEDS
jgi:hypothetical protein